MISSAKKKEILNNLSLNLSKYSSLMVFSYKGFTANEFVELRKKFQSSDYDVIVTKNSLVEKAILDNGSYDSSQKMSEQNLFVFLNDELDACKKFKDYVENEKLNFKFLLSNTGKSFDIKYFKELSNLPSEKEIKAKLLSLFMASLNNFNFLIKEPLNKVARILQKKSSSN